MAKWFIMPPGVDSVSVRQMEFHPQGVQDGVRYFAVPEHFEAELVALNIRTGMGVDGRPIFARFQSMDRPVGVEDAPEFPVADPTALEAVQGQVLSLHVQIENLRAQIAELTVERDELRLRVAEFEAPEIVDAVQIPKTKDPKSKVPLRLTGTPADPLLDQLSGMTLGKD